VEPDSHRRGITMGFTNATGSRWACVERGKGVWVTSRELAGRIESTRMGGEEDGSSYITGRRRWRKDAI